MDTLKLPPHDLEAERGILGAVLLDARTIHRAQELMSPQDFYRTAHQVIFRAMCQLAASGEPIDCLTLADKLDALGKLQEVGGRAALAELIEAVPSAANVGQHCKIVRECAHLRQLIRVGASLQDRAYQRETSSALVIETERVLFDLQFGRHSGDWRSLT